MPGIDLPVTLAINVSNGRRVRWRAHGCGEDWLCACAQLVFEETPPRAWGRHGISPKGKGAKGNTPTGVGKTRCCPMWAGGNTKHPHRRGEDPCGRTRTQRSQETPPQAWGRLVAAVVRVAAHGNTPTGVGKTTRRNVLARRAWKHPHRRGEDGLPDLAT